ncbi:c-type cytochrome [Aliishimia ponticola]|uniref:C-type cytochrome n=1 Tax=Aliishimia ponticola TaxID=2499833 RepID=A0A4S4NJR3_9RHOB|nr:c-type cytochrome [Aliishimia ponticola]THH38501.1 c-type cytochrome [Aliishimia ponticola]
MFNYGPLAVVALLGAAGASSALASDTPTTDTAETEATRQIDLEVAEKIFRKSCRACHGNKAQGAASYPSLSDKDPAYITERLERYRAGEKIGPNSILMIQHAKKLSDDDIASLSVYVTTAFE